MSSLLFLAFSTVAFILTFGVLFTLTPMVLGAFYTAADNVTITDPEWAQVYEDTEDVTQFLVPLVPSIGIFFLVLKVLMVASARGRD